MVLVWAHKWCIKKITLGLETRASSLTWYSYNSFYYYYILYYIKIYFFYNYRHRSIYKRLRSIAIPFYVTPTFCPATDVQQYRSNY